MSAARPIYEKKSLSVFLVALGALVAILGAAIYVVNEARFDPANARAELRRGLGEFSVSAEARVIDIERLKHLRVDASLIDAETFLPAALSPGDPVLRWIEGEAVCRVRKLTVANEASADVQAGFAKWRAWTMAKCHDKDAPFDLLTSPPFIHPLGGSWALYMQKHGLPKWNAQPEWQKKLSEYSHVLEADETSGGDLVPSALTPSQWQAVLRHESWVLTRDSIFAPLPGAKTSVVSRPAFQEWLSANDWSLDETGACRDPLGGLCFSQAKGDRQHWEKILPIVFIGGFSLVLSGFILLFAQGRRNEKRAERDRQMVMQTLAHELRHPATSLQLSLEVLRDQFDALPPASQIEFLRMLDQVQKLNRVLEASRQYLQSGQEAVTGFQFDKKPVEDVGAFVRSTLQPYEGKLAIDSGPEDVALAIDKYWLGVCITNLVKNALIHGGQPIAVSVRKAKASAVIEVRDSGGPPALTFEEMVTPLKKGAESPGMGLGLSLVYRLMELMGGKLEFVSHPKAFVLTIEEKR